MKKKICLMLVFSLLCASLAVGATSCASGEKLYVYNWGLYIDEDVLDEFEARYGITVVYDEFDTNETMYQTLTNSNAVYDVIIPSDYMISKMIAEDMLQEIDMSQITNLHYIDDTILEMAQYFDENNTYSVPYTWGTLGLLYNPTYVQEPVTSWNVLWDESYKGHIFMYDSQRDSLAVALKRLGYSLNTTNTEELTAAADSLVAQKPLVMKYVGDEVIQGMKANEAWMAVVYNGDGVDIMSDNPDLRYVVPEEGSNIFIDSMVIPKNAQNVDAAHLFINFMCETDIAYRNSLEIGYSTPHTEAYKRLEADFAEETGDADYLENYWNAYWPMDDVLANLDAGTAKYEVFYDLGTYIKEYEAAWNRVMGDN